MKMNKKKKLTQPAYNPLQMQTPKSVRKKKSDPLKARGIKYVDFRDVKLLTRFINEQGKILPSRITGLTSKMQRQVTLAIKRARHLGLMPYITDEFRA